MASNHCTGCSRPTKVPNERRLTVREILYQYPPRKDDPQQQLHREKKVPWLQMKGLWLQQAGFEIDTPVKVRVMEGCLVLTTEGQS